MLHFLAEYGLLFFGACMIALCIGLQVVDFINWISGDK